MVHPYLCKTYRPLSYVMHILVLFSLFHRFLALEKVMSLFLLMCRENAGLLALTRVGSRRVVQIAAVFMIFFSILGKFYLRSRCFQNISLAKFLLANVHEMEKMRDLHKV